MQFEENAKLLTAESKTYSFNGNEGVSHRVRLNINGEIFVAKSTEEQVRNLAPLVGKDGVAVVKLSSPKEALKLECLSFVVYS